MDLGESESYEGALPFSGDMMSLTDLAKRLTDGKNLASVGTRMPWFTSGDPVWVERKRDIAVISATKRGKATGI